MKSKKNVKKKTTPVVSVFPHQCFYGTVDALLEHCSKIEPVAEVENLFGHEITLTIKEELGCSYAEADKIAKELQGGELDLQLDSLIKEGYVTIDGEDSDGNPKILLTAKGKKYFDEMNKQN